MTLPATLPELVANLNSLTAAEEQFLINCVRDKQAQIVWFRDKREEEIAHVMASFNAYMEVLETELTNLTQHAIALGVRFSEPEEGATANVK